MKGLQGFNLNRTFLKFLDFYKKKDPVKRKKLTNIISTNKKNPKHILKFSGKKTQEFRSHLRRFRPFKT